ncbi:metallophosphoesterase [Corallococcus sp. AB038B]|uniref:metallophosphoesterase family protein n=1 Tax=Corallococcus sp. AB038B TaxID=2316718 RepID=UPI0013153258|nr:metallophosphoesterase [Corallococcus sp. AB038B]
MNRPFFSWIHLSDIHVGHGDATHIEDQKLVLGALRRDVEVMLASGVPRPDAIFVTGDIAFSGACRTPDEYMRAVRWLTDIARAAGLELGSVFVVPGNHDVQRPADKPVTARTLLRQLRKGEPSLDEVLADSAGLVQLRARQANYLAFAEGFAPACRTDAETPGAQLYWRHTLEMPGGPRLRIIGLNTALLAADESVFKADQGRLWLGTRQLSAVFTEPEVAPNEVAIVLSHHPLRDHWLADETNAARWIRRHAHLHLSGHVHEGTSERAGNGGGTALVSISAGAVHGEKTPHGYPARHGYNFGALVARDGALKVRIWPRMWSDVHKDFRLDVDNVPPNETYAEHDLPRMKAPVGVNAEAPAIQTGSQRDASPEEPRKIRLTVHRAFFLSGGQECFFINATNSSRTREVELTHVWLQLHSQLAVHQADRPLPRRLKPDESWETWIRVDAVPEQFHESLYTLARARLSSGQVFSSEKNDDVPEEGAVPGGPIREI